MKSNCKTIKLLQKQRERGAKKASRKNHKELENYVLDWLENKRNYRARRNKCQGVRVTPLM